MGYYIALDVGGTNIKAGVIDNKGLIIDGTLKTYEAKANESKEIIFNNLLNVIKEQANSIDSMDFIINGIGLAFPGPFDYEKGISYITGINKYESLYGLNVKNELTNYIHNDKFFKNKLDYKFTILFDNDANLFALGEYYSGKAKNYCRSICICLGTGIGSAFVENGSLIKFRADVPQNGWVYDTPFKDSIVDNYISSRGIIRLAKNINENVLNKNSLNENSLNVSVREIAEKARQGDSSAKIIFDTFGTLMGEALLTYIESFKPNAIVLGGQISKSSDLFKDSFNSAITPFEPVIEISENSSISTLIGIYNLFNARLN